MRFTIWLTIIVLILAALLGAYIFLWHKAITATPLPSLSPKSSSDKEVPMSNAKARVTKKTFGLYVTPQNSPVQPEKFTGYHTGVDFETFLGEENKDVPVYAVCDGPLKLRKPATGYGGVVVQSCVLDGQAVTVIYGHLNISSIVGKDQLKRGDILGILGKGYSSETSGERKHLHLGIHKGVGIDIRGYVQLRSELSGWLDPMNYLTPTSTQLFSTDNVRVSSPSLYGTVSSPVQIIGEAKGTWYFEAVFPITITDANGKELGKGQAHATSDWMTTNWVPFTAMITFNKPTTALGRIIFHKDNPSGLPENEKQETMIVRFR